MRGACQLKRAEQGITPSRLAECSHVQPSPVRNTLIDGNDRDDARSVLWPQRGGGSASEAPRRHRHTRQGAQLLLLLFLGASQQMGNCDGDLHRPR